MSKRQLREPTSSSTRQPFSSLECEPTDCNGREKAFYGRVNDKRMARNSIHIEKYRPKDTFYHTSKPKSELIPPQEHPLLSTPSRQKENATRGYEPRYWGQGEPSMTSSAPSLRDIGYKEEQGAWSPGSDIERSYNTHKVLSNRVRPAMDADDEERDRKRDFKAGKIKEKNRYLSMDEARKIIDRDENFNKVMKVSLAGPDIASVLKMISCWSLSHASPFSQKFDHVTKDSMAW